MCGAHAPPHGRNERRLMAAQQDVIQACAAHATATLDRRLHCSTTLNIKGESYRVKEKQRAGLLGHPKPTTADEEEIPVEH